MSPTHFYLASDEGTPRFTTLSRSYRFDSRVALDFWLVGRNPDEVKVEEVTAGEFGIVYDSNAVYPLPPKKDAGDYRDLCGGAVFATRENRDEAVAWLRDGLGCRYFNEYKDLQGFGLQFARRQGPVIRPSARNRLPSVQRARRDEQRRSDFQRSLYRNPAYDLVNEPYIEPPYA